MQERDLGTALLSMKLTFYVLYRRSDCAKLALTRLHAYAHIRKTLRGIPFALFFLLFFFKNFWTLWSIVECEIIIFVYLRIILISFFQKGLLLSDSENLRLWTEHVSSLMVTSSSDSPAEKLWRGGFLHLIVTHFLTQCQRRVRPPFYDANSLVR